MRILTRLFICLSAAVWGQTAPGFDPTAIDHSVNPCDDFYQFACGAWMAANPVPADQSRWGRFDALQDRNREVLHKILEAAAVVKPGRTALDQKIGDYYASCMDQAAIDAKGAAPLKPDLERIAALKDKAGLTDVVAYLFRAEVGALLSIRIRSGSAQFGYCDCGCGSRRAGIAGSRLLLEDGR